MDAVSNRRIRAKLIEKSRKMPELSIAEQKSVVLKALENPSYKYRTLRGISEETGLPLGIVKKFLTVSKIEDLVVSRHVSTSGDSLFSTRQHLKRNSNVFERLSAALVNRAD